jgi:hypothetical protein
MSCPLSHERSTLQPPESSLFFRCSEFMKEMPAKIEDNETGARGCAARCSFNHDTCIIY